MNLARSFKVIFSLWHKKKEHNNRALIPVTQPMVERALKKMFFFLYLFPSIY